MSTSRQKSGPRRGLPARIQRLVHADGYQGYHKLPENIRVVGCWAHARRRFDEALQMLPKEMQKDAPAAIGECYCSRLFKLEQAFAELTPEER